MSALWCCSHEVLDLNNTLNWFPKLVCSNPACQHRGPIFLPGPSHLETSVDQPNWPKDTWQAFAVCHECGYGYMYTKKDVQWGRSQDFGLWESSAFLRIELKCDHVNCKSPVVAYAFWPAPALQKEIQRRIVYGDGSPVCEKGHSLAFPLLVTDIEGISREALP